MTKLVLRVLYEGHHLNADIREQESTHHTVRDRSPIKITLRTNTQSGAWIPVQEYRCNDTAHLIRVISKSLLLCAVARMKLKS